MLKHILLFLSTSVLLFALDAPTNLIVQATSKTSVTLDWTDNSDDESGFKIFRDGYLIKLTPKDTTHFEDRNLKPNTTYTYLVYATNHTKYEIFTDKNIYTPNEDVTVSFRHLSEANEWIGIYPAGTPDSDINEASWRHIDNKTIGVKIYNPFTEGTYEVRTFTDDNTMEAQTTFKVQAQPKTKKLILAQGGAWRPSMAENMIARHNEIMQLPFDGYTVVANEYTNEVMGDDPLDYDVIMNKVRGLTNLYQGKDMFLTVKIKFPGDFWNQQIWDRINTNFAIIAKVAKDLGFKGIAFDDEADKGEDTYNMINFKFPKKSDVEAHPEKYKQWEIDGALFTKNDTQDDKAYRNDEHNFTQHIDKVIVLYQDIMQHMVSNFPKIQVLVYHGPIRAHDESFSQWRYGNHKIIDASLARANEFVGALFTGLKRGAGSATIHDMGEMYKLRTNEQFARFYQWRKYDMVRDIHNDNLKPSFQWRIPTQDRTNWGDKIEEGYMVFNKIETSNLEEFNVTRSTTIGDIKTSLKLALSHADEYAIYYCQDQEWLMPGYKNHPFVGATWVNMLKEVNP